MLKTLNWFCVFLILVDELVENYGLGKTKIKKCKSCWYEQAIESSGVHVSQNGAVKVYADPDPFYCPTCHTYESCEDANEKGMVISPILNK